MLIKLALLAMSSSSGDGGISMRQVTRLVGDKFLVKKKLGQGGFGAAFLVTDNCEAHKVIKVSQNDIEGKRKRKQKQKQTQRQTQT